MGTSFSWLIPKLTCMHKQWLLVKGLLANWMRPLGFIIIGSVVGFVVAKQSIDLAKDTMLMEPAQKLPAACSYERYSDLVFDIRDNRPDSTSDVEVIRCWDTNVDASNVLVFAAFQNLIVLDLTESRFECSSLAPLQKSKHLRVLVLDRCNLTADLPNILKNTNITGLSIKYAQLESATILELFQIRSLRWIVIDISDYEKIKHNYKSFPPSLKIVGEMDGTYTLSQYIM